MPRRRLLLCVSSLRGQHWRAASRNACCHANADALRFAHLVARSRQMQVFMDQKPPGRGPSALFVPLPATWKSFCVVKFWMPGERRPSFMCINKKLMRRRSAMAGSKIAGFARTVTFMISWRSLPTQPAALAANTREAAGGQNRAATAAWGRAALVAALVRPLTWSEASAACAQGFAPLKRAPQPGPGAQPMAFAALAGEEAQPGTKRTTPLLGQDVGDQRSVEVQCQLLKPRRQRST